MTLPNRIIAAWGAAALLLGTCSTSQGQVELVVNGGFETGDFTGWTAAKVDIGEGNGWAINNGTFTAPDGFAPATAPIAGQFDAMSYQGVWDMGGSRSLTSGWMTVPVDVTGAVLSWADRIRNWDLMGRPFGPDQELRVQILAEVNGAVGVAAEEIVTLPGDALRQLGPNVRTYNVTSLLQGLEGLRIRLRFEQADELFYFNVNLDNISLLVAVQESEPEPDPEPEPEPEPEPDPPITVLLDVMPGSDENPINLKVNSKAKGNAAAAGGVVPVAILSTPDFDARRVDVTQIALGDPLLTGFALPIRGAFEDVDLDGDLDLVLHFSILNMVSVKAIGPQTTSLCLAGFTRDGAQLIGCDSVRIVPAATNAKAPKPPKPKK